MMNSVESIKTLETISYFQILPTELVVYIHKLSNMDKAALILTRYYRNRVIFITKIEQNNILLSTKSLNSINQPNLREIEYINIHNNIVNGYKERIFNLFSACQCCERHNINKPNKFTDITRRTDPYARLSYEDAIDYYRDKCNHLSSCSCSCRHFCRAITRTEE
jgi:hypothetical protein